MNIPFIILCFQTLILWMVVVLLHRFKNKITLIPLYSFIAVLTVLTHNFSDLGFSIILNQWFFLVASFSFFTPLMFAVLLLYLFDGPKAARSALWVIILSSITYIVIVFSTGQITDTSKWVIFNFTRITYYFWSLLAIIVDIFFMAIFWELLSKIKSIPLLIKIFFICLGVFSLDTLIFTSGVFATSNMYLTILQGNLITRLALSCVSAIFITLSLKSDGFSEENRQKPQNIWEILNFRSDLEIKIKTLEEAIAIQKTLEEKIKENQETYELAITGAGAGIWDWNTVTNQIFWSPKFCQLLQYSPDEIEGNLDAFKKIIHPDDNIKTFAIVDKCFETGNPYETEYRLKTKSGEYRWFLANGIVKFDSNHKPVRMVGSIIDINNRKKAEITLHDKVAELTQLNQLMVDREVKMVSLKEELSNLKRK